MQRTSVFLLCPGVQSQGASLEDRHPPLKEVFLEVCLGETRVQLGYSNIRVHGPRHVQPYPLLDHESASLGANSPVEPRSIGDSTPS